MDSAAKYELLQRIAGEQIVAFRGRQTMGGQIVLLHQLTGTNDHTDVLRMALDYLLRNPASGGGRILDVVEIHGSHYLVTLDQPECLALREWLKWELEGAKAAPAYAPQAPAPTREPGEFTRLFQAQQAGTTAAPVQPAPAQSPAPGEFTHLFGRAGHNKPSEPPPMMTPAPVPPSPLASEKQQPGEFTRMFRSPLATPAESPMSSLPPSSPSSQAPGEFTRIFGGGTPRAASTPPPAASTPMPPPVPASAPGALTESLEPRHASTNKPDVTPLSASAGPGEFTRVIRGPASGAASSAPAAPPPPAPASPPIAMSISTPSLPSAPSMPSATPPSLPSVPSVPTVSIATPSVSAAPQAATGGPSRPTLIILFVVLLVAALALIAFVLLRR